jgi:hypothetical protein
VCVCVGVGVCARVCACVGAVENISLKISVMKK